MATVFLDIAKAAMYRLGVLQVGEDPTAQDAEFIRQEFNRILGEWNTLRACAYTVNFFTKDDNGADLLLSPNNQKRTIGPTGDYVFAQRPVEIVAANVLLNDVTPIVRQPLYIRDDDWWASVSVRGITTTFPTDLYYSPDWDNGALYFWPIPTIAYGLELEMRVVLSSVPTISTAFSMPPGYENALIYTLAETLSPSFGVPLNPALALMAQKARSAIKSLNSQAPHISTQDSGIPTSGRPKPYFNWRSGLPV